MCPKCGSYYVRKTRMPYCGPGDTNYIFCKCLNCLHSWEEKD